MHNGFRKIYYERVCREYESLWIVLDSSYFWSWKIIETYYYLWKILLIIEKRNHDAKTARRKRWDKKIVGNFHYRVREWILMEWKVPHSCNRLDGYAFCGLHIVERTGVHALCIFCSRSIFRGFEVSGKARSYTTYRAKTYCNRDRFVAIKHGMQTPYANVVSCNHEIVSL